MIFEQLLVLFEENFASWELIYDYFRDVKLSIQ